MPRESETSLTTMSLGLGQRSKRQAVYVSVVRRLQLVMVSFLCCGPSSSVVRTSEQPMILVFSRSSGG